MIIDAAAAKALFAIVLASTQGTGVVRRQLPLNVTDQGDSWLVTGTPYTDLPRHMQFCMCHVFFVKRSAEVIGIGCDGRMILTAAEKAHWSNIMLPEQYAGVFGPRTRFEPNGILDLWFAAYGGVINKPSDALDYAYILMQMIPSLATISRDGLQALERDKVWHINTDDGRELMRVSRETGKLLSGDF